MFGFIQSCSVVGVTPAQGNALLLFPFSENPLFWWLWCWKLRNHTKASSPNTSLGIFQTGWTLRGVWSILQKKRRKEGQNVVIKELCSWCVLFCPWVKSLATSWDLRLGKGQGMWELPREGNYSHQVTLCFNFSHFYLFSQDFQPGASLSVREASEWMRRCQHCCRWLFEVCSFPSARTPQNTAWKEKARQLELQEL